MRILILSLLVLCTHRCLGQTTHHDDTEDLYDDEDDSSGAYGNVYNQYSTENLEHGNDAFVFSTAAEIGQRANTNSVKTTQSPVTVAAQNLLDHETYDSENYDDSQIYDVEDVDNSAGSHVDVTDLPSDIHTNVLDGGDEDDEELPSAVTSATSAPHMVTYESTSSKLYAIIGKPGIMAGIVGAVIIGILSAGLLIMFIVYRMRKKDEGSYALEETKKPLNAYDYKHCPTREFYA